MGRKNNQRIVTRHYNAEYDNEFHKINQNAKDSYEYHFSEKRTKDNGKKVEYLLSSVVITPELLMEKGEAKDMETAVLMVKTLHRMRNAEVDNNLENSKTPLLDAQKEEIEKWREAYKSYRKGEGEYPGEAPDLNWHQHFEAQGEDDENYKLSKSPLIEETATHDSYDEADIAVIRKYLPALSDEQFEKVKYQVLDHMRPLSHSIEEIRERMKALTERQFAIYVLVKFARIIQKDVAELLDIQEKQITKSLISSNIKAFGVAASKIEGIERFEKR